MDVLDVIRGVAVLGILLVNIAQSVAGVLIFNGIGFRMFGRVSLTIALAGCVALFVLQMVASRLWLSRALFGPAEWLWRAFT